MICQKCGAEVPEKESYCPNCGNAMQTEGELTVKENNPVAYLTDYELARIKKRSQQYLA